jgi:hypothetical protein
MMTKRRVIHRGVGRGLLAAALALTTARIAGATTELPAEFGEMVRGSQLVVHGRVVDVRSQQTGDRRSIETLVTVAVAEALKGQPGPTVTFRMPGGEVGRYRRVVVGVPAFAGGDSVVVFLRGGAPALPTVYGLNQGLYRVTAASDGRALVSPAPIAAPAGGPVRIVRGDPARRPLPLEAFAREVRARVEPRP